MGKLILFLLCILVPRKMLSVKNKFGIIILLLMKVLTTRLILSSQTVHIAYILNGIRPLKSLHCCELPQMLPVGRFIIFDSKIICKWMAQQRRLLKTATAFTSTVCHIYGDTLPFSLGRIISLLEKQTFCVKFKFLSIEY